MKLIKIIGVDIRDAAQTQQMAEQDVNKILMDLQVKGCTILGVPQLFMVTTSRFNYSVCYDNPLMDEKKEE